MPDQTRMESSGVWEQAVANFGEEVVAYVTDTAPGEHPATEDQLRRDVIHSLAHHVLDASLSPEQTVSVRCHLLAQVVGETDQTYLEACRAHIGGRLPEPSGDALVDAFTRLVFNGLAMEHVPGSEWDRFAISASFQDPTLCEPAMLAFLQDEDLGRLFPDASRTTESGTSATSLLTWLPAGGGTTFLAIVVGAFVEQTLARMRFMNAMDEENVEAFVRESLDQLRQFARGEEITVLLLTGLIGIEVAVPLDRESGYPQLNVVAC